VHYWVDEDLWFPPGARHSPDAAMRPVDGLYDVCNGDEFGTARKGIASGPASTAYGHAGAPQAVKDLLGYFGRDSDEVGHFSGADHPLGRRERQPEACQHRVPLSDRYDFNH
jgi:hypothetical protein